jgi:hypothetical protein
MLRQREADDEERRRGPRWALWIPAGLLVLLVVGALVPLLVPVQMPLGPGHWLYVYTNPRLAHLQPELSSSQPMRGADGEVRWETRHVRIVGPLFYVVQHLWREGG